MNKTPAVFISGITISDDGSAAIKADELPDGTTVQLIKGEPGGESAPTEEGSYYDRIMNILEGEPPRDSAERRYGHGLGHRAARHAAAKIAAEADAEVKDLKRQLAESHQDRDASIFDAIFQIEEISKEHAEELAKLEAQLARQAEDHTPPNAIEALFMAGVNHCMRDEETGGKTECLYPADSISNHWWTRGYAHQARAFRAIELAAQLRAANIRADDNRAWVERAIAEGAEQLARLRAALHRIIKRTQDCAPLVAIDVREIAEAALRPGACGEGVSE